MYRVYTVERIHALLTSSRSLFDRLHYHNIVTRYADGTNGWPDQGPFDAILVSAGAPDIPETLTDQLAIGGRLILPVGSEYSQELVKLYKDEEGIHKTYLGGCRFVRLIGEHGWKQ